MRSRTTRARFPRTAAGIAAALCLGLLAHLLFVVPVQAQSYCGKHGDVVDRLAQRFGETRRSMGFADGVGVVEVYASAETGTWTILVTDAHGVSCLIATGDMFHIDGEHIPGDKS